MPFNKIVMDAMGEFPIDTQEWISEKFASSVEQSGWQKLPSGVILQWGYSVANTFENSADLVATVTYPIAFPNAVYFISGLAHPTTATPTINSYRLTMRVATTNPLSNLTSVKFAVNDISSSWVAGNTVGFSWMAIGR